MARNPHADIARQVDATGQTWFDGKDAVELILRGFDITKLAIRPDAEIAAYNAWCDSKDKPQCKITPPPPSPTPADRAATWWLGEAYTTLDVRQLLLARCSTTVERERVNKEMQMYEQRDLLPLLRLMVMLVDHFRKHNVVWGVGRGSSVASYVLFLIGIHKIDSLFYNLDIEEFLR